MQHTPCACLVIAVPSLSLLCLAANVYKISTMEEIHGVERKGKIEEYTWMNKQVELSSLLLTANAYIKKKLKHHLQCVMENSIST